MTAPAKGVLRRGLADHLLPHWRAAGLVGLVTALVGAAAGCYPLVINWTFDALDAGDRRVFWLAPLAIVAVSALKALATLAQIVITNRLATDIEVEMQTRLYRHLLGADDAATGGESVGALTQRFTGDVAVIRDALTRFVTIVLRDLAILVGVLVWMLYADWRLTLAALLVIPPLVWPLAVLGARLRRIATALQRQMGEATQHVMEGLSGLRIARLYRIEGYLEARTTAAFEAVKTLKRQAADQRGRIAPLFELAGGVAVAIVVGVVGWRIAEGETTIGAFIAFITALLLAAQPLQSIGQFNAWLQEAIASLRRYFALIDAAAARREPADAPGLAAPLGDVAFEGVRFSYDGERPALRDASFSLPGGKATAVVGRSGAGKSSLFLLLTRIAAPHAGRILIGGQDIAGVRLASLREAMAVVTQDEVLFDDTVARNVGLGREGAGEAAIGDALRAAAADGFVERLPEGRDTRIGPGGSRLSGGERQRVALARALLRDAPILLLDEATSALDAEAEARILAALKALRPGRTTVMVAHRLSSIRDADHIVVLEEGAAVEAGDHASLIAKDGAYARLHRLQTLAGEA